MYKGCDWSGYEPSSACLMRSSDHITTYQMTCQFITQVRNERMNLEGAADYTIVAKTLDHISLDPLF